MSLTDAEIKHYLDAQVRRDEYSRELILATDLLEARAEIERLRLFERKVSGDLVGCWIMTAAEHHRKTTCDKPDVCTCACGMDARAAIRHEQESLAEERAGRRLDDG